MNAALTLVSDPLPAAWSALAVALEGGAWVAVTADLRADLGHEDPHASALAAMDGRGRLAGPQSGGALVGHGTVALVSRIGPAFAAATRDVAFAEAVDLGLGWDLDEADLVARWAARGDITCIGLAAPRPSARLASALRDVQGRIAVIVADPFERPWYYLGAGMVPSLEALRLALSLGAVGRSVALVGSQRPALDLLASVLTANDIAIVGPSRGSAAVIAQDVHTRAELGPTIDLLGGATTRHATLAARVMAEERVTTIAVGVDAGPDTIVYPAATDAWAFARGLRARIEAAREVAADPLPMPSIDLERAQTVLAAALLMKRNALSRSEAVTFVAAMGFGRPAPTLQVASVESARAAAQRLGWPVLLGAPGTATLGPLDEADLDAAWDQIDGALAADPEADRYAARWLAAMAGGRPFRLLIVGPGDNDVGPVGHWQVGGEGSSATLPLRVDDAGGPQDLLGAASGLVRTFADLTRVEVIGSYGADGAVIGEASVDMRGVDGA